MRLTFSILALAFAITSCATTPSASPERVIVEFPVHSETRAEFIEALNLILVDTRAFDGCLDVTVWTNEQDADKVWLLEDWQTRDHQAAYLNWRVETGNTSHLQPFLAGDLRFLWLDEH